jgi:hypothetical protein
MGYSQQEEEIIFNPSLISFDITDQAKAIMTALDENIFIIERVASSEKQYEEFIMTVLNNMTYGFEHKEFRDHPAQYKFRDDSNEDVKWLPFRHFLINIIFWYPMVAIDFNVLDDTFIIPSVIMPKISGGFIKNYWDAKYVKPYKRKLDNHRLNEILHDATFLLSRISAKFNMFLGISISIEVFRDLAERIPEFKELLYFNIDETMQPAEIEQTMKKMSDKQLDIILNDNKFNLLKPLLAPKAVKKKQFDEVSINIGLKPDADGNTIPTPINNNYITGNLGSIQKHFVNNISGRKAAIINNEFMGSAGHLLILVATLTESVKLSKTTMDCHTANPIPITITDSKFLRKLDMRRYKFQGEREYHTINADVDDWLIGQTILLRSPVTCACKDGICRECYGDLYYTNESMNSVGAFAAFETMNPVVQGLLSAKHHQGTSSSMIEFEAPFDEFFSISATDIIINPDIEDAELYSLVIRVEDFRSSDEDDDNDTLIDNQGRKGKKKKSEYEDDDDVDDEETMALKLSYYTTSFYVVKNLVNKKKREIYRLSDKDEKELFMHTDFVKRLNREAMSELGGDVLYINIEDINADEFIFMVEVENNELTKPMKSIEKLIDNKNHEGCLSYEEMVEHMTTLLIQSGISAMSVHGEMIIRQLVRRSNNKLKRPNFSRIVMKQDYELLTIKTAVKNSPQLATSLSTAYLKYQLIDMTDTFEKTDPSDLDDLFRPNLSLDHSVGLYRK